MGIFKKHEDVTNENLKAREWKPKYCDLVYYRDRANKWRWRVVHRNTNIVAASTEGYVRRVDAVGNAKLVLHPKIIRRTKD